MFENKKKFALWMYPDTLQKVGEIYRQDNCESKSEFTAEQHGQRTARKKSFGDASADWITARNTAKTHLQ